MADVIMPGMGGRFPFPGMGVLAAPSVSVSGGGRISLTVGGSRIQLPDLPPAIKGLQATALEYAKIPLSERQVRTALGRAQAVTGAVAAALNDDILGGIASAAAMAPPPYGPAIAIGASLAKGIFGAGGRPPKPSIGGRNLDDVTGSPLATANDAVLAAKIVSGDVGGDDGAVKQKIKDNVLENAGQQVRATLRMLKAGKSLRQADDLLHAGRSIDGRRIPKGKLRAVAYFCAYTNYDTLMSSEVIGENALRPFVGKLLGWAAPRVQIREMLWYWYLYRVSLAAYYATGKSPERDISPPASGFTQPVPGFRARWVASRSGWTGSRRLAGKDDDGTPDIWADLVRWRAAPRPIQHKDTGLWSYTPLDERVLAKEVAKYDSGKLQKISDVPLPGLDRDEWVVRLPDRTHELTWFPESHAKAATLCKALVAADMTMAGSHAGQPRGYVDDLAAQLQARKDSARRLVPAPALMSLLASVAEKDRRNQAASANVAEVKPKQSPKTAGEKPSEKPVEPTSEAGAGGFWLLAGATAAAALLGG